MFEVFFANPEHEGHHTRSPSTQLNVATCHFLPKETSSSKPNNEKGVSIKTPSSFFCQLLRSRLPPLAKLQVVKSFEIFPISLIWPSLQFVKATYKIFYKLNGPHTWLFLLAKAPRPTPFS